MSRPAQMFDHELNPVKGWPSPYAVDKAASPAEGVSWNGGMVMHLNAAGALELGALGSQMPIFMLQNSTDPDVHQDYGSITGGTGAGIVACGGYEVESTEFVGTFAPNDLATSPTEGDNAGMLVPGDQCANNICLVVSDAVISNDNNLEVLRGWTVWYPDLTPCIGGASSSSG